MRVFVPSTLVALARASTSGELPVPDGTAFAVTPASVEVHTDEDSEGPEELEELEMLAAEAAAGASLRLLAAETRVGAAAAAASVPRRRVVVAVDVADTEVTVPAEWAEVSPDLVHLAGPVPMAAVASVLADPSSMAGVITRALPVADDPPPDPEALPGGPAWAARDEVEASPLLWFDASEIGDLTAEVETT